jgi:signal transduction histidine kinase
MWRSCCRLTRLLSQLLAATRLDWVALDPDDRADLQEVSIHVAALLAPIAIKAGKTLEVTGTQTPVIIRGNADALEQAVRNLVENAIRYSDSGTTITIDISAEPMVRVMDRGPGIPDSEKERIFKRFRRSDQRFGGAGLGLSIVQRTADIHSGTVDIEDRSGGGSIFALHFPGDLVYDPLAAANDDRSELASRRPSVPQRAPQG